jgi:DNA-binding Lrp family transcriptional regulator
MDNIDIHILQLLKENSRIKFTHIGKSVGLSEGAIRRRIKNLVNTGIIRKFTIETHSNSEGIVLIKTEPAFTMEVVNGLKNIADRIFELSGDFDIAALISATDLTELNKKVDNIRKLPYIKSTNTLMKLVGA